jgi:hypothetical protein
MEQGAASAVVPVGRIRGSILYVEIGDPIGTDITKQLVSTLRVNNSGVELPLGSIIGTDTNGDLMLASAASPETATVIGICLQTLADGEQGRLVIGGETNFLLEDGIPSPESGDTLYLSATQPGRCTPVPAGIAGAVVLSLGRVASGALYIEIGRPIHLGG